MKGGNFYDKYGTKNLIERFLVRRFTETVRSFVDQSRPTCVLEIGCGEGHLLAALDAPGRSLDGIDLCEETIAEARGQYGDRPNFTFETGDIYALQLSKQYDLIVCCEVLEHLPRPVEALEILASIGARNVIVSVPREPIWRMMNIARGKYLRDLGNTPGHVNHWSATGFQRFVASSFRILGVRKPLPWTILHCAPRRDGAQYSR
jgi:2-polyprenyl-3-methyl-5-hydroxy-6-metoxy-1,4-benzoquinol methylase